jgi:Holliday junction resolvasome RuvABC endonuclease subunit
MATVVGIDPSLTSSGVAVLVDGQPVHVSHHGYGGTDGASYQSRNRRGRWMARQIRDAAMSHGKPDLAIIEGLPPHIVGVGVEDRGYLWGKVYEAFDWPEIPIVVINPQNLKVWVTGKGASRESGISKYQRQKRDKRLMIDTIEPWWPDWKFTSDPESKDDECEAAALALIGAFHVGDPIPFVPKPRHMLTQLDWSAAPGVVPELGQMTL